MYKKKDLKEEEEAASLDHQEDAEVDHLNSVKIYQMIENLIANNLDKNDMYQY